MDDLKQRFSEADRMKGMDHWRDISARAARAEASPQVLEWPPASRRRAVAALVAFAVFVAASVFAWNLSHPDIVPSPPPPAADPEVDLAAELPVGWSELPAPPEVRRAAATAWTGSKLIVWGGYVYVLGTGEGPLSREGSVFDAGSRRWEPMAPGPLSARSAAASAWTGDEFLVWGGRASECCVPPEAFLGDGAAYDPAARRWRRLPEAPIEARAPLSVWTGDELIVWGSADRDLRFRDGAAYDPTSNTWRQIADGPIELTDAVAVWSGKEMVVFGAALHAGGAPETETAIGAAYNPATDSWRELPPSLGSNPNANTAVWADGRLIAMDYDNDVETYEPSAGRWRNLAPMPLDDGEDVPSAAYVDGWVLARFFRGVAAFSTNSERWVDLTAELADVAPRALVLGRPIDAGGVFLVFALGPRDRSYLLAYNPPPLGKKPTLFVPEVFRDGDLERLPVVFPDGSEVTLVYPTALDLAALGVQPDVTFVFDGRYQGRVVFLHDPDASIARFVDPNGPEMLINSSGGGLHLVRARGDDPGYWLRFELPSWTVLVPIEDPMPERDVERAALALEIAGSLEIRETASGFPVIETPGNAELAEGFGEAGGPELTLGDARAEPDMVSQLDATIFLSPGGCTPATDGAWSGGYGSVCLGDGNVFASIYGDREFVTSVIEGVRVEDFRHV
jgi:hypothetical protein